MFPRFDSGPTFPLFQNVAQMLAADGSELRHRPVAQPVSEPGKYQEESILVRRAKMAQEDREPANLWVFGLVIVLWCLLCGVAWYVVIRHDEHYIIDEIHHGHVANVREFLHEHHAPYRLNKLDEVGCLHLSKPALPPRRTCKIRRACLDCRNCPPPCPNVSGSPLTRLHGCCQWKTEGVQRCPTLCLVWHAALHGVFSATILNT